MANEIKEILDSIQEHLKEKEENFKKGAVDSTVYYLYCDNARTLLDYITNLQEQLHQASLDIQELTERDIECPSWCDKLTNLQEEIDRLNKECYAYMKIASNKQRRIDKAIEYIKENADYGIQEKCCMDDLNYDECDILLNILQG